MVSEPDDSPIHPPSSLGRELAQARATRGWSTAEIASRLRIRVDLVEALERDDHAAFGAVTYARGQMRNYARLVGIDLPQTPPTPVAPPPRTLARRAPELHPRRPHVVRWGGIVITAGLVVLGALWARDGHAPDPRENAPAAAPTAEIPITAAPQAAEPTPEPAPTPSEANPAPADAASAATAAEPAPTTEPAPSAAPTPVPAGMASVRIRSRAVSWVEVTDHSGKRLVYELVSPGAERAAQGVPPFRVLLGNAPSVELLYNDAPVSLPAEQHVVRLTLGAPASAEPTRSPPPAATPAAPTP